MNENNLDVKKTPREVYYALVPRKRKPVRDSVTKFAGISEHAFRDRLRGRVPWSELEKAAFATATKQISKNINWDAE